MDADIQYISLLRRQAVDHPYLVVHGNYAHKKDHTGAALPSLPSKSAGPETVLCGICLEDVEAEGCTPNKNSIFLSPLVIYFTYLSIEYIASLLGASSR